MLTKQQKEEILKDLVQKLEKSQFVTVVEYSGLSVAKMSELRKSLREVEADIKVAKKTLIDLALEKANLGSIKMRKMGGELALVFGYGDNEIMPAKALHKFSLRNDALKILGGVLDGQLIGKEQFTFLAKLSSREEMLARLVGTLSSPLSGLASVLSGNTRNLVYVLSNIKK